jgi:hypothetical protein
MNRKLEKRMPPGSGVLIADLAGIAIIAAFCFMPHFGAILLAGAALIAFVANGFLVFWHAAPLTWKEIRASLFK